jgi:hypothetical protein
MDATTPPHWTQYVARLNTQRRQLRDLLWLRSGRDSSKHENDSLLRQQGIDPDLLYPVPRILGQLLNFTIEEDENFKREIGKFPGAFSPDGETREQTQKRRRDYGKPQRAAQQRERRAAQKARLASVNDIDCRTSAVFSLLSLHWIDVSSLMKGVGRSPAFRKRDGGSFLTKNSLKQAVLRELRALTKKGVVERRELRNIRGLPKHLFRRK